MEGFWDAFSSLLLGVFCDLIIRGFASFLLGDYMKNQGGILVVALFSGCVRMFKGKGVHHMKDGFEIRFSPESRGTAAHCSGTPRNYLLMILLCLSNRL